ncbi:MAG: hypothetical protein ACP5MK_02325 [Candidatus Micrarchaeia archaeon]
MILYQFNCALNYYSWGLRRMPSAVPLNGNAKDYSGNGNNNQATGVT